jgi:CheY-like chemotaxis protein
MDVHMPVLDGIAATQEIRRMQGAGLLHGPAPIIVALTADAFAEDRRSCLDAGMDDYLAKPFERTDLEAMLERIARDRIAHVRQASDAAE